MFGAPRGSVSFTGGYSVPRAGGDLFAFFGKQLTLGSKDFRARSGGVDVSVALPHNLDVVAGFDISKHVATSEYRHFVASNGSPIAQQTHFDQTGVSAGVRYSLLGRGRAISRYAFIPRRVVPYAGGGVSLRRYSLTQYGQFVDAVTLGVFTDSFLSDGWVMGPYLRGGVDLHVWRPVFLTMDGRYTWQHGALSSDFTGFDGIDLAGFHASTGFTFVF
jgi:hypothetical protein